MKKFGLIVLGIIAAIALLANLGHIIGLAISLVIFYFSLRGFLKSSSFGKKLIWGIIGFIAIASSASNIPAIVGILAAGLLYYVYKKWQKNKDVIKEEPDPFTHFEREWADLKK